MMAWSTLARLESLYPLGPQDKHDIPDTVIQFVYVTRILGGQEPGHSYVVSVDPAFLNRLNHDLCAQAEAPENLPEAPGGGLKLPCFKLTHYVLGQLGFGKR